MAEAKAIYEFTKQGYHIFNQVSGKAPFDLVIYKEEELLKVSVKSVLKRNSRGKYEVQLKRVRSNKTENKIYPFDNSECDLLVVYIVDLDKLCIFYANKITAKHTLNIPEIMLK